MPVYNTVQWVKPAIESILFQTYNNLEIIVVDGGSTDGTISVIKSIKDEKVKLYETMIYSFVEKMNYGIIKSNGEYIARMDSDDIAHPYRLEKQINVFENNPNVVFVSNIQAYITPNGYIMKNNILNDRDHEITKSTLRHSKGLFSDASFLFKKNHAVDVNLYDTQYEKDTSLWYKLLSKGQGISTSTIYHFYRKRAGQLSVKQIGKDSGWYDLRKKYDPGGLDENIKPTKPEKVLLEKNFDLLLMYLASKEYKESIKIFKQIWAINSGNDFLYFRRKLLEILGRDTLRFWKWNNNRLKRKYVPYKPENQFVSNILLKLGLKLL
jgi:glycosyltransferase involved in cell wall biosynthesis